MSTDCVVIVQRRSCSTRRRFPVSFAPLSAWKNPRQSATLNTPIFGTHDWVAFKGYVLAELSEGLQNMQSVAKAFADYFGYQRQQDEVVSDIIMSHACRHVIVHNAAVADRKMMGLLRAARPRTLMPKVGEGDRIQFTEAEVELVGDRMKSYLDELATGISR